MATKPIASKYKFVLFLLLLFYINSKAEGMTAAATQYLVKDSSGIVISAHQFDSLVGSLLIKFKSDTSEKKIEDYILLVKVCNTIGFDQLYDSCKKCNELYNLYNLKYVKIIAKATDATISIGYSYYSKKYDLQIGGKRTKNNYFRIVHY